MQEIYLLPLQIQASLAAGYITYAIAHRDQRSIKTLDVLMLCFLYGLPVMLFTHFFASPWVYLSVLISPLILGILVAKYGRGKLSACLRYFDISYNDSYNSVLDTMMANKEVKWVALIIRTKDNMQYYTFFDKKLDNCTFEPFIIDEDGIAIYVSKYRNRKESEDWIAEEQEWVPKGYIKGKYIDPPITYIPRSEIASIEFRYTRGYKRLKKS